jgi:hypothetical protein
MLSFVRRHRRRHGAVPRHRGGAVPPARPARARCRVELDALSDPGDDSGWSADDLISMDALSAPQVAAVLDDTPAACATLTSTPTTRSSSAAATPDVPAP